LLPSYLTLHTVGFFSLPYRFSLRPHYTPLRTLPPLFTFTCNFDAYTPAPRRDAAVAARDAHTTTTRTYTSAVLVPYTRLFYAVPTHVGYTLRGWFAHTRFLPGSVRLYGSLFYAFYRFAAFTLTHVRPYSPYTYLACHVTGLPACPHLRTFTAHGRFTAPRCCGCAPARFPLPPFTAHFCGSTPYAGWFTFAAVLHRLVTVAVLRLHALR